MATIFDAVSTASPQRSTFDLSHDRKYTMNGGDLVPILCQEVVPGDKFNIGIQSLIRLIPMVGPTMHKIDMDIHAFYVPNRINWKHWERFITGSKLAGVEGGVVPTHPYIDLVRASPDNHVKLKVGSLMDYLGYPVVETDTEYTGTGSIKVNALPLRAYELIWKEYYRDQNLMAADDAWDIINDTDGDQLDLLSGDLIGNLHKRCWEKDYFTSALPFVQKGEPLSIPLAGTAPVQLSSSGSNGVKILESSGAVAAAGDLIAVKPGTETYMDNGTGAPYLKIDPNGTLVTDLTGATASTINDLRAAFQAQLWLEKNARAGTRYIESLEAHFGVRPADYRLQRPELFGATRVPVSVSEVLQTSETATSPQGNMAGHGIGFGKDNMSVFCPEHGWIIIIASIKPRTSYMTAVNKSIFRLNYLDYYWPEFARLGEQAIKYKELGWRYAPLPGHLDHLEDDFGYQSRYAEYRCAFSTVHGGMRVDPMLKNWHMARENVNYQSTLNSAFVESDPVTRVFADTEAEYQYIVHTQFNIRANRPMPFFADPGMIDHQ